MSHDSGLERVGRKQMIQRSGVSQPSVESDLAEQPFAVEHRAGDETPPAAPWRPLPALIEAESDWKRRGFLLVALLIAAAYGFMLQSLWVPAPGRPGIDENAYLVAGKNIAQHGTTGFKPTDDYQYVGAMWIRTPDGWYYPKYPAGLPMLYAIAIWLGGNNWAFAVSPICMVAAILGMFLLTRMVAGSFCGLLGMIVLGTGSVSLELANIPNSHAPALCMVVLGMLLLVRWWQSGAWYTGIGAGMLLGYAVSIRYSEALLLFPLYPLDQILADTHLRESHGFLWFLIRLVRLLPIGPLGLAVMLSIRWKQPRSYLRAGLPILAWAIPVGALLLFNRASMGRMTGYDLTNESTGFSTAEFARKWDFTVHELYQYGLFLLMPLGIVGLMLMYRRSWRMALLLAMWVVPGTLLYTAYYWGRELPGVGFLRFLLTLLPALIIAALWLLREIGAAPALAARREDRSIAWPLAAGVLTAAAACVSIWASLPTMQRQHRGNLNMAYSAGRVLPVIRAAGAAAGGPLVFVDDGMFPQLLQYLQFMADGQWYSVDAFDQRAFGGFGLLALAGAGKDAPVPLQRARIDHMTGFLSNKRQQDLIDDQHKIIDRALADGRGVLAILTPAQEIAFRQQAITGDYEMQLIERWVEPCAIRPPFREARSSPLLPPAFSGEPLIRWNPQVLAMYRIVKK